MRQEVKRVSVTAVCQNTEVASREGKKIQVSKQVPTCITSLKAAAFNPGKALMILQGLPLPGTIRKKCWRILNINIHVFGGKGK